MCMDLDMPKDAHKSFHDVPGPGWGKRETTSRSGQEPESILQVELCIADHL